MLEETSGITLPICYCQCVEQHVKFVAEVSARVARFDRQEESFDKKIKSCKLRKTLNTKKQFKYSALVIRVTSSISWMDQN